MAKVTNVGLTPDRAEVYRKLGLAGDADMPDPVVVTQAAPQFDAADDEVSAGETSGQASWWIEPDWAPVLQYSLTCPPSHRTFGAMLFGSRGTGKTTAVREICKRIGRKAVTYQCARGMSVDDLLGTWSAENGTTKYIRGPLATAIDQDAVFVAEEANMASPAVWSKVNTLLDGSGDALLLPDGSRLQPGAGFRLVLAYNPDYAGCQEVNEALKSRLMPIYATYLPEAQEIEALKRQINGIDDELIGRMVALANQIRAAAEQYRFDFSPRELIRWANVKRSLSLSWMRAFEITVLDCVGDPLTHKPVRESINQVALTAGVENW